MSRLKAKELVDFVSYNCCSSYVMDLFHMLVFLDSIPEEELTPAMRSMRKPIARGLKEYRDSLPETYEKDYNSIAKASNYMVFLPDGTCMVAGYGTSIVRIDPFVPKDKKVLKEYELANADTKTVMEKEKEAIRIRAVKESKKKDSSQLNMRSVRKYAAVMAFQFEELLGKKHHHIPEGPSLLELMKMRQKALKEANIPFHKCSWREREKRIQTYGSVIEIINGPINKWLKTFAVDKKINIWKPIDIDFSFYAIRPENVEKAYRELAECIEKNRRNRSQIYKYTSRDIEVKYGTIFTVTTNPKKEQEDWMPELMAKLNMI